MIILIFIIFGNISFNINYNKIISSNQIFNYSNDYQYLRYDINKGSISENTKISFFVAPFVQFPFTFVNNKYQFNLGFYSNNINISNFNYPNLDFNVYSKITNIIGNNNLIDANNIRLEYYISSNINSIDTIKNNICEIYFRDFVISKNNYDINNFNITQGKNIDVEGVNNISIGSNFSIIGNNSIVIGSDNSKNPIYESIVIGKNNFKNTNIKSSIIIGNNNTSEIINSNQIIIGNDINNKFLLNIGNVLCRDDNKIYLGLSAQPVIIGYDTNDIIDLSDNNSLYIKGGISTSNISIKNSSNKSITFKAPESLKENINYVFPEIPKVVSRLMMTSDKYGV